MRRSVRKTAGKWLENSDRKRLKFARIYKRQRRRGSRICKSRRNTNDLFVLMLIKDYSSRNVTLISRSYRFLISIKGLESYANSSARRRTHLLRILG